MFYRLTFPVSSLGLISVILKELVELHQLKGNNNAN